MHKNGFVTNGLSPRRSYYHDLLDCVEKAVSDCGESPALEFLTNSMENIFGQVLGLVCGQFARGSLACKALPTLPELEPGKSRIGTFIEPIISIANSFRRSR